MSYTIEDFHSEMKNTQTPVEMTGVIDKLLDSDIDVTNPEIKEMILEYRSQIEDYRMDMMIEEDKKCSDWIESGKCEVYLCKKDVQWFKSGNRYHVWEKDNDKKIRAEKEGFRVVYIWEDEIKNNDIVELIISKIFYNM